MVKEAPLSMWLHSCCVGFQTGAMASVNSNGILRASMLWVIAYTDEENSHLNWRLLRSPMPFSTSRLFCREDILRQQRVGQKDIWRLVGDI